MLFASKSNGQTNLTSKTQTSTMEIFSLLFLGVTLLLTSMKVPTEKSTHRPPSGPTTSSTPGTTSLQSSGPILSLDYPDQNWWPSNALILQINLIYASVANTHVFCLSNLVTSQVITRLILSGFWFQ